MKKLLFIHMSCIVISSLPINSWGNNELQIEYEKNNNLPSLEIDSSINKAKSYWNECLNKKEYTLKKLHTIHIVWNTLNSKEYAATEYSMQQEQVLTAMITINNKKEITQENLDYIITHEFGHILQAKHNLKEDSVMFYKPPKTMSLIDKNQTYDNKVCIEESD